MWRANDVKAVVHLTIGVTTFLDRYDPLFKELLKRLNYCFPKNEIIVVANGHHSSIQQDKYLKRLTEFCNKFPNTVLLKYNQPQGLSKLWNDIIQRSKNENVLILNDDILFDMKFPIGVSSISSEDFVLINNSFSHFLISKKTIDSVGWFDENLEEIGGEDDDFLVRSHISNIKVENYRIDRLSNYQPKLKVNSYGKKVSEQQGGYSNSNTKYLMEKWKISKSQFEGAIKVDRSLGCYWKLNEGFSAYNKRTRAEN